MYLLDQGIILALLKGNPHALRNVDENFDNCYIPAIVAAELYRMNYPESKKDSMKELMESFFLVEFGAAEAFAYGEIQRKLEQNGAAANIVDVMIAATALSLDATIVTHRYQQFRIISQSLNQGLNFINWITLSDRIISPYENKPGVLYRVTKLMQELNINIVESYGGNNKRYSLIIDVPYRDIPEQLQSRLINVEYKPYNNQQQTQIQFDCIPISPQSPNKKFHAEGKDRVGLLADVTKLIAEKNVNIIVSGSHIGCSHIGYGASVSEKVCKQFYMMFCLYGDLNESEWQALLKEIKKVKDGDDNEIDADLNNI